MRILCFNSGERKIFSTIKASLNIMSMVDLLFCLSLLTSLIFKLNHILAGVLFIFVKKQPRPNLGMDYQIGQAVIKTK